MFVSVLPHSSVVSSMTGAGLSTVDHVLDRNVSRWPCSFPLYVDAIYEAGKFPKNANFALEKLSTRQRILYQEVPFCYSLTKFNLHAILGKCSDSSQ